VAVEGTTDAGIAQVRGDTRVMALVGALFSDQQIKTLQRHKIESVVIALDPDKAGDVNIARNVERLLKAGIDAFVAPRLPDGVDPDEFIKEKGIAEWKRLIGQAAHGLRLVAEQVLKQHKPEGGWTDQVAEAAIRQAARWAAGCVPEGQEDALRRFFVAPILQELTGNADEFVARVRLERKAKVQANGTGGVGKADAAAECSADGEEPVTGAEHGGAWEGEEPQGPNGSGGQEAAGAIVGEYTLGELLDRHTELRPPVIHGLLRRGETMNVIPTSKTGKSWLVVDLVLAVASGGKWLGAFEVDGGEVLILDNELHGETLADRVSKVAAARGIPLSPLRERVTVKVLRGRLTDIHALRDYFRRKDPGRFKLVVLDSFYRLLPAGVSENDNAQMATVYNAIDAYADHLQACFVAIHHSSKGNQQGDYGRRCRCGQYGACGRHTPDLAAARRGGRPRSGGCLAVLCARRAAVPAVGVPPVGAGRGVQPRPAAPAGGKAQPCGEGREGPGG
jgi:hypothetical protein